MLRYFVLGYTLIFIGLSQAQVCQHPIGQQSLISQENLDFIDEEVILLKYLNYLSLINKGIKNNRDKIDKMITGFLNYYKEVKNSDPNIEVNNDPVKKNWTVTINDFNIDLDLKTLFLDVKVEGYVGDIIFSVVKKSRGGIFETCEIAYSLDKRETQKIQLQLGDCIMDFSSGKYFLSVFIHRNTSPIYEAEKDLVTQKELRLSKVQKTFDEQQAKLNDESNKESQTYQEKLKEYYEVRSQKKQIEKEMSQFGISRADYDSLNLKYNDLRSKESKLFLIVDSKSRYFSQKSRKYREKINEQLMIFDVFNAYEHSAERVEQPYKSFEAAVEKDEMIEAQDGVVAFKVVEKISADSERRRLRQQFAASDFTPTGFYLPPDTKLKLNVKSSQKNSRLPRLLIGTYARSGFYCFLKNSNGECEESKQNRGYYPREKILNEGENIISDPLGGLLYIRYVHDQPSKSVAHISFLEGMKPVPFFKLGKTVHEKWMSMLEDEAYKDLPDVILEGERTMIVASRDSAIQYKDEDPNEVLRAADNIVRFQDEFSGLDGSSEEHKPNVHKYLMTQTSSIPSRPYVVGQASDYYTNYNEERSIDEIMTKKGLLVEGHTPLHEIGHMYQQPEWRWSSISEIGANLYAWIIKNKITHAEEYNPRRYEKMAEYFKLPDDKRDFNKVGDWHYNLDDVRLSFFKQLYEAYGEDFYKKLHQYVRENPKDLQTDEKRMEYFMLAACHTSENNLRYVFRKWGFKVGNQVYRDIDYLKGPSGNYYPYPDNKTMRS